MKRSPKQTGRERVVVGVLAAEAVEAEAGTIIAATLVNRANRAGKIVFLTGVRRRAPPQRSDGTNQLGGEDMPRGRSTWTKRQKEQTRQQRQRDKAERREQRKQEKTVKSDTDDLAELHEHAAAQAAMFQMGSDSPHSAEPSSPGKEPRD